ncbi:MAG: iron ABC transporter permease [Clostridia bacterium]|nr:iron ABC transporter permease [Clostridia bacterium]
MKKRLPAHMLLILLLVLCAGLLGAAFLVGSSGISIGELMALIRGDAPTAVETVFLQLRLPRAIGALLVGAALSLSGCTLQSVFRNPMADPFVLGISAGAALGAAVAMAFGGTTSAAGSSLAALLSFASALLTIAVVYTIARVHGRVSTFSLLLSGFTMSSLLSALLSLLMILNRDKMEQVVMWTMGSLSAMSWEKVLVVLPLVAVCAALLMLQARTLNVMLSGDESAESLGVDTHRARRNVLILTSLLAAAAVSVSGVIGFVGLMVPHLLRLASGPDNRTLMPLSLAGGAAYLLFCDMLARTVVPGRELPVGVVTAILGVPFFIVLLHRSRGSSA